MKSYLVVSNKCSLQIDEEFYLAGKPFELNEEKYWQLQDLVELLGVKEEQEEEQEELEELKLLEEVEETPKKKGK